MKRKQKNSLRKKLLIATLAGVVAFSMLGIQAFADSTTSSDSGTPAVTETSYPITLTNQRIGNYMFKLSDTSTLNKDSLQITYLGTNGKDASYQYFYKGTADQARTAGKSNWIAGTKASDGSGNYTFTIPVNKDETSIKVAALSNAFGIWFNRTFTIDTTKKTMSYAHGVDPTIVHLDKDASYNGKLGANAFTDAHSVAYIFNGNLYLAMDKQYKAMYVGSAADAAKTYDSMLIKGTKTDAKDRYEYEIPNYDPAANSGVIQLAFQKDDNSWQSVKLTKSDNNFTIVDADSAANSETKVLKDGNYSIFKPTISSESIIPISIINATLHVANGKYTVDFANQSKHEKIYLGSASEAANLEKASSNKIISRAGYYYTNPIISSSLFTNVDIPGLDQNINIAFKVSGASTSWTDATVRFSSDNLASVSGADYSPVDDAIAQIPADLSIYTDKTVKALNDSKSEVVRGLSSNMQTSVTNYAAKITTAIKNLKVKEAPTKVDLTNGTYALPSQTSGMFSLTDTTLHVKDGKYVADFILSGTGQKEIYLGTKEEAAKADVNGGNGIIKESAEITNSEGKPGSYFKDVPISSLDTVIAVAAKGASSGKWFDRSICFYSSKATLVVSANYSSVDAAIAKIPADLSTFTAASAKAVTDAKSAVILGLSSNMQKGVDKFASDINTAVSGLTKSSTGGGTTPTPGSTTYIADGTYTPDSFNYTGGTNKTKITCPSVTVTGGKAYATIVFSSDKWTNLVSNGTTISPIIDSAAHTSTFVNVPVVLNTAQEITGTTTAMSAPHDITYSITITLNGGTAGGNTGGSTVSTISLTAPEITAALTDTTVNLSWNSIKGASGYTVYYRKDDGSDWTAKNTTGNFMEITGLMAGSVYNFKVVATAASNSTTVKSADSNIVSVNLPENSNTSKLGKVTKFKVKKSSHRLIFTWGEVKTATGYQLYRSTKKAIGFKKVATRKNLKCTIKGLKNGKTYYFKVRAFKTTNGVKAYGSWSKTIKVKI